MRWIVFGTLVVAAAVVALISFPMAWLGVLALLLVPLLSRADGRLLLYVGGTLTVFQSSAGISAPKVIFFVVAGGIGVFALFNSIRHFREPWARPFRAAMAGAGVIFGLTVLATIVGLLQGVVLSEVIRDGVTYLLIAAAVPVALDAARVMNTRAVRLLTIVVTSVSGASLMLHELTLRGVSNVAVDKLVAPSMMVLSAGVALACVRAFEGRRLKWGWLGFGAALVAFVLASGSREGLVLLAAALPVVGIAFRRRSGVFRLVVGVAGFAAGLGLLVVLAASTVTSSSFLQSRLQASLAVLQGGSLQDASGIIRARATAYALDVWWPNWAVGVGFGHVFPDPNPGGGTADFQVDSSATLLAKFGLIGCALLLVGVLLIVRSGWGRFGSLPRLSEQGVAIGAVAVWFAQLYFGSPTEDRGFSLAVLMIVLLLAARAREDASAEARDLQKPPGILEHPSVAQRGGVVP